MAKGTRGGWTLTAFALMAAVALVNAGCLLVAAGAAGGAAAGYFYYQGKVCMAYDASFDDTRAAVRTALSELGMPVVKEEDEKGEVFIESRTTDGDRVRIYMDTIRSQFPAEGPLTRVCIRVATFGDHPVSYRIFDWIGAHLVAVPIPGDPNGPAAAAPSTPPAAAQPPAVPPETPPPPLAK
ncbi:MAG TPA: DUF3568 family protein [Gemmataceae bacterium]|nr:DUF3568 family protein [Gemmataceae bacterium]